MFWRFCRAAVHSVPTAILCCSTVAWAGPTADKQEAESLVREALHREVFGLTDERQALLEEAQAKSPQSSVVQWATGNVKFRNRWVNIDDLPKAAQSLSSFSTYHAIRDRYADNSARQFELAKWCERNGLDEQARAHLTRVIELEPNHLEAREKLGFIRSGQTWISVDEVRANAALADSVRANFARWQPKIVAIREGLQAKARYRREAAFRELYAIQDPNAVGTLEALLGYDSPELCEIAIKKLSTMTDREATRALMRLSVHANAETARKAAAAALKERPFEDYVPVLLGALSSQIQARQQITPDAEGRLLHQQVFVREGQESNQVVVLDTAYRRVAQAGGLASDTLSRALNSAGMQSILSDRALAEQNARLAETNTRIMACLTISTGTTQEATPQAWWLWWNSYNEVFVGDQPKSTQTISMTRYVSLTDRVLEPPSPPAPRGFSPQISSSPAPRRMDCLAAGTLVWTALGSIPVEQVKRGDLVLSQNVDTGELAYKPVLQTTIRPAGPLVRIEAGRDGHFDTSGGHLFWVAGEGWTKARELKSGMQLHTSHGTMAVSSVQTGPTAPTYNLVVADFNTYFAGYDKVLSHDNTLRRPTKAIVPGLVEQP